MPEYKLSSLLIVFPRFDRCGILGLSRQCRSSGISRKGNPAVVVSGGFRESGAEGVELEHGVVGVAFSRDNYRWAQWSRLRFNASVVLSNCSPYPPWGIYLSQVRVNILGDVKSISLKYWDSESNKSVIKLS